LPGLRLEAVELVSIVLGDRDEPEPCQAACLSVDVAGGCVCVVAYWTS
jgi:hypothetical protein